MAEKTTILDMNRFDDSNLDGLDENKRELVRRRRILGKGYRLFYKDPVEIVRGKGSHVFDEKGKTISMPITMWFQSVIAIRM